MQHARQELSKSFAYFINSLKAEATKKQYVRLLTDFMRFIGKKEFDELLIGPEDKGQTQIQNQIIEFVMHLRDQNLARSNIAGHVSAIKHFYDMNDVLNINWSKINKFKGDEQEQKYDRPYTRQEIKLLIDNALSLRDKAIISLLMSSGMRKGGIIDLRIKDLLSIEKYNLYRVTVYARSHDLYYTYCTPESRKYIDDYLAWRERLGEKMTENSILFRKEFDIRDSFEVRNNVKRLTLSGVTSIIRELSYDLGVRQVQHLTEGLHSGKIKHEIMLVHGFRKYFDTTCTSNGMDKLYVEVCMGHDLGLKGSYYKPTWQEVLEGNDRMQGYVSVINDLTIAEENRLRKQVAEQECTIQHKLAEKDKQINVLLQRDSMNTDAISALSDKLAHIVNEIEILKQRRPQ